MTLAWLMTTIDNNYVKQSYQCTRVSKVSSKLDGVVASALFQLQ